MEKKNENDIVLDAKQKSKFFEEYYASLQTIQDKLTIEEINIMAKALEVATVQAKEREAEKHREETAAKERAKKEAERKKKEREEKRRAAKLAREEAIKHREHVKSVTCMDLPLDFSNAFEGNDEICEHVESVADGLIASLDNLGAVDIEYISEITGIDMKDIIKELDGAIYQNPLTWNECWYKGSVLFIDEAYSLVDDKDGLFGDEAINTIVQEMEKNRDDLIVVFAGYPDKMEGFLNKNPGLRSRIAFHIRFDDYEPQELLSIADMIANDKGLVLSDGAKDKLKTTFEKVITQNDFGNGRFARNIIEKAQMKQLDRIVKMNFDDITDETVSLILAEDIPEQENQKAEVKMKIGFCA